MSHSAHRGLGAYARSLLAALERTAPRNRYVLFIPDGSTSDLYPPRQTRVMLSRLPFGRASALVSNQVLLPLLARSYNLDVLHVLDVPYNPSHALAPVWKSVPQVITLHDLTPLNAPIILRTRRYRLFYRAALWQCKRADALVVDSETSKRDALRARVAPARRIFVAPLAVPDEPDELTPTTGFNVPSQPYILHIGSDDWNKNREGVLLAFALLPDEANLHLVLVGGSEDTLEVLPEELRRHVTHYHWLDRASLRRLYEQAAVLVFPSRYEGFGLPILEAMGAGTPVVTSNRGAMKEVAGGAALLADPNNPAGIATAVLRILGDPALAQRLRALGKTRAAGFTWERTARVTLAAYQSAANKRASPASSQPGAGTPELHRP
jgi:glycosyltransferase involved in cell wall biosynthesis